MTIAELALLITTLSGAIVALINTRANSTAIGKLQEQLTDAQDRQETARKDIIAIGEQLHFARLDNAVIAEAFNQLFIEFREVTGHKPAVNIDRLKHMQTISYITGPLEGGPLQVKD